MTQSPAIQVEALFLCHQIGDIDMADNKKPDMPDKTEQPVLDNAAAQDELLPFDIGGNIPVPAVAAVSAPEKSAPSREPIPIFKENPALEARAQAQCG